jgi:hypothetical protein
MTTISTPWRVAAFVAALVAVFAVAWGVGRAVGPIGTEPLPAHDMRSASFVVPAGGSDDR